MVKIENKVMKIKESQDTRNLRFLREMRAIQKKMIRMLKNKKKYGGAHTETIHLKNCVPKHLRGQKIVGEAISDLFRKGILINKKSTGELHCSLDSSKLKDISEIENY